MKNTEKVKKASHHIQKEVNYMQKSTPYRVNGLILENIFKQGKDIQIYNEEKLQKLAATPIGTRERHLPTSYISDFSRPINNDSNVASEQFAVHKPQNSSSSSTQQIQSNASKQLNRLAPNETGRLLSQLPVSNKAHENLGSINREVSEMNKNSQNNIRTLAKGSALNTKSSMDIFELTISIYKDLVQNLEAKCSILEATSLSQDDKVKKIQRIDNEISVRKRQLNQQANKKYSKELDTEFSATINQSINHTFLLDKEHIEVSDSSDDDSLILAANKELQKKQKISNQQKQIIQTKEKANDENFDDYENQVFDDFDNGYRSVGPIHSELSADESRDHVSLSKLHSNSNITDEAEIEDSHYFSSGNEYSHHQSDIDFVSGGDSDNNGDESYIAETSDCSHVSSIEFSENGIRRTSDDPVIIKTPSGDALKKESMKIVSFDDSFEESENNLNHIDLSGGFDDEVIELSSDYQAERENAPVQENIDLIDQDFEIISLQVPNSNIKNSIQREPHVKPELLSDGDDSDDDELEALVFNQIDRSKALPKKSFNNSPAGKKRYPWTNELEENLQQKFKLTSFRSNQLDAINATLEGKDVFVLMPTGGGKSLCYQLPATVKNGRILTTVVVSPLISLMQDQVDHLKLLGINAAMISSKDGSSSRKESFQMFRNGMLDLIYLSPEMLSKSEYCKNTIKMLYDEGKLARFVIDEAHCVSSWGHDFRPDYKLLSFFKRQYPDIPMMALTATASVKVRTDIISNLGLNNVVLFKQSFNRPNLIYMVRPKNKNSMFEMISEIKDKFYSSTGIIYCNSKKQCETTSKLLESNGLSCSFYHAGMENEDRSEVQLKWQSGEIKIVCATVAFGMGIDKPDVRFVYHHTIPRSLEGYYQECGRAGRDGKTAFCTMYYQYADFKSLESQIKRDKGLANKALKQRQLEKLHDVLNYCSNTIECRRKLVLQYFNENFNVALCRKTCDNCKASNIVDHRDITENAKDIVSLIKKICTGDITSNYIIDVYRGSNQQKIVNNGHSLLEEHGKGSKLFKDDIQRIIQLLLDEGFLREKTGTNGFGFANTYIKFNKNLNKSLTMGFIAAKPSSSASPSSRSISQDDASSRGDSYKRTADSSKIIHDILSKSVNLDKDDLKEFQKKKKELAKDEQLKELSALKKRKYGKRFRRSRRS